jgi:hypothetical protein
MPLPPISAVGECPAAATYSCFRRLRYKTQEIMPMAMTPRATPTPIPASAPVDNFELACAIDVCEVLLEAEDVPLVLVDVVGRSELCQLI